MSIIVSQLPFCQKNRKPSAGAVKCPDVVMLKDKKFPRPGKSLRQGVPQKEWARVQPTHRRHAIMPTKGIELKRANDVPESNLDPSPSTNRKQPLAKLNILQANRHIKRQIRQLPTDPRDPESIVALNLQLEKFHKLDTDQVNKRGNRNLFPLAQSGFRIFMITGKVQVFTKLDKAAGREDLFGMDDILLYRSDQFIHG